MRGWLSIAGVLMLSSAAALAVDFQRAAPPPPCHGLDSSTVAFTGRAVDVGNPRSTALGTAYPNRLKVEESFAGLALGAEEVVITTLGAALKPGASYFIETRRNDDGSLPLLGGSLDSPESAAPRIAFLRQWAAGKTRASLAVKVQYLTYLREGATVSVAGPDATLTRVTNADGLVVIDDIQPGRYLVSASESAYSLFSKPMAVEVSPGFCSMVRATLAVVFPQDR